jgi:hypothetical protein
MPLIAITAAGNAHVPRERSSHADDVLAHFVEVDARLVAAGFPATSEWWLSEIRRWYDAGKRQFVPRVGRRGGKSSTLS